MDAGNSLLVFMVTLIAFAAFHQWLRHHRRIMIHRERLAAVEKGLALPPVDQEVERGRLNVPRILLLAGCCWIALGIATFGLFSALAGQIFEEHPIPHGLQWIGVALVGIGLSHLLVFLVSRKKDG